VTVTTFSSNLLCLDAFLTVVSAKHINYSSFVISYDIPCTGYPTSHIHHTNDGTHKGFHTGKQINQQQIVVVFICPSVNNPFVLLLILLPV